MQTCIKEDKKINGDYPKTVGEISSTRLLNVDYLDVQKPAIHSAILLGFIVTPRG